MDTYSTVFCFKFSSFLEARLCSVVIGDHILCVFPVIPNKFYEWHIFPYLFEIGVLGILHQLQQKSLSCGEESSTLLQTRQRKQPVCLAARDK